MKISGFTFVRNAVKFDYPVKEAILSVLPLCDEFIVSIGNCDDGTEDLIKSINDPRIKISYSVWDDSLRHGGRVLAIETDKAYEQVSPDADWVFYIQGDEILHEKYLPTVREALQSYQYNTNVDGLLFKYIHFYGSYDYVGEAMRWYRKEIRIIRKRKDIFSYRDAQGFRKLPNTKLNVIEIDAYIYHYGWVRPPRAMYIKQHSFGQLYNGSSAIIMENDFDYSEIDALSKFNGTHPKVMADRIERKNWLFEHDLSKNHFKLKDQFKRMIEKLTGWRPGEYKNYKIIK